MHTCTGTTGIPLQRMDTRSRCPSSSRAKAEEQRSDPSRSGGAELLMTVNTNKVALGATTTTPCFFHRSELFLKTPTTTLRIRTYSKTRVQNCHSRGLGVFLLLLVIMVEYTVTAFVSQRSVAPPTDQRSSSSSLPLTSSSFLVPSQVRPHRASKSKSTSTTSTSTTSTPTTFKSKRTPIASYSTSFLVPSQVKLKAHSGGPTEPSSAASSSSSAVAAALSSSTSPSEPSIKKDRSHPNQKRIRRRKKKTTTTTSAVESTPEHRSSQTTRRTGSRPANAGNLPDVYWRSISLEHLRHHPHFESLPLPETIERLDSLEDIRLFRQESWQWDAVHEGRCTTSQAVAALGFLEKETGRILGIPQSWRHGGMGAYHRLRKPALRTLEEMNASLCGQQASRNGSNDHASSEKEQATTIDKDPSIWKRAEMNDTSTNFPFAAKYMKRMTQDDMDERRQLSQSISKTRGFDFSVRMMWGNAQEATALLTALNYFWEQDNGIVLKEVGMCGGGLKTNHTTGEASSLLVGATPDGLLCYPNGTIEALEVKNHCPFFPIQSYQQRGGSQRQQHPHHHGHKGKRFSIRHFDIQDAGFPSQYIPQLMMEMFCVGDNCRSSIMVRQTATSGSLILRIRRDDGWIEEMLYWLNRFQLDFVEREEPPPPNFFLEGSSEVDRERYTQFLEKTKDLQAKVEVVSYVPHSQIQRAMAIRPGMANLFLD